MIKKIEKIAIIGGGTSAWLTAAYLKKNIIDYKEIVVIDKENSNPVGVGEATILNFKTFMDDCGFEITDWFSKLGSAFKGGILFPNWGTGEVWHPFAFPDYSYNGSPTTLVGCWTKFQEETFKENGLIHYDVCKHQMRVDPDNLSIYAFHLDALNLVEFIKDRIIGYGVDFIQSEVVGIQYDADEYVSFLDLKNGSKIEADLYVDCTGFNGLIYDSDKVDLSDRLYCDTAVATQVPYENQNEELHPYVNCPAVESGWIWEIPLQTRIGSGLVFNRNITSPDDAKVELSNHWNGRVSPSDMKVLDWTPYYNKNFWKKNVVNIGLSAGFIEPLESTGIALICAGISSMFDRIQTMEYTDNDINLYNAEMTCKFEDCIDFVNMHYSYSEAKGKFWDWIREVYKPSEKLLYFKEQLENNPKFQLSGFSGKDIFSGNNWIAWMIQLGNKIIKRDDNIPDEVSYLMMSDFVKNEMNKYDYLPNANVYCKYFNTVSQLNQQTINPYR